MRARENAVPYSEEGPSSECPCGGGLEFDPYHAVLGEREMRLCGYRSQPSLYFRGEMVDLGPYVTRWGDFDGPTAWSGELEGYRFSAKAFGDYHEMLELELVEPDGVRWAALSGYLHGVGHVK